MDKFNNKVSRIKLQQHSVSSFQTEDIQKANKDKVKQSIATVTSLAFLGIWIGLSMQHNLFFNEAIVCSSIILSILFMKAAEQNGDLDGQL